MDRRLHHRFAARGSAAVTVLHEVDIESASATGLTVLATEPAVAGVPASLRVTAPARDAVTLRVVVTGCLPVPIEGRRRYRVTYAVTAVEACALP